MRLPADPDSTTPPARPGLMQRLGVAPDVLWLGLVSFLTDLSSEMIFAVFAVFFTGVAGASSALLGLIEGLADLSACSLNTWSGWLSDRGGRRKVFALAGYGFSTLAKMLLLVSTSIAGLALFRVIERLGKGFRGPPRDAWLSQIAHGATRGYAFGVHKALDKAGAVAGPLLAWALLSWLGETPAAYRNLFAVAVVPALLSIAVLARLKDQPGTPHPREPLGRSWAQLSPGFKRFLLPAGLFALAYYSLGFLLLKAHDSGFSVRQVVLLYALFNATCVLAAPAVGALGDRIGRRPIVALGYALYGGMNLALPFVQGGTALVALFGVYGLFYAVEDSQSKAFIADLEPERRATAIGLYNALTGLLYLPASAVAGALWALTPRAAFGLAAALSAAAVVALVLLRPGRGAQPA